MFMDEHCTLNFWISHMRLHKVVSLLQSILSWQHRQDKVKADTPQRCTWAPTSILLMSSPMQDVQEFSGSQHVTARRSAAVSVAIAIPAQPFAKSVLSGTPTEVTLVQQLIKLSHFWGHPSGFCLRPLYQEVAKHGLVWNNSLCSVLALRPFSCWKRGGRSGPRSVTEDVLAAACHLEEQQCSLLGRLQRLPGVVTLVDEDQAPPVLSRCWTLHLEHCFSSHLSSCKPACFLGAC